MFISVICYVRANVIGRHRKTEIKSSILRDILPCSLLKMNCVLEGHVTLSGTKNGLRDGDGVYLREIA
jgi:hypothetical protein